MGWGNIYKRRVKVFTLAIIIYLDYKTLQKREYWINKSKRAALWEKAHERNAKRVLSLMIELEGLWVKLGQYLSTRADVLPNAYISLLKQLQDSLPPRPLKEVSQTIQKQLGKSIDELFLDFDRTPLATASATSSVLVESRRNFANGREVVVKVQHAGIKKIILEDLKNAKAIIDWIAWAEPQYDFNPMIDEWCREAPKELDFNHEAENTRTVAQNLGCKNKHKNDGPSNLVDVLIPEVIQSTEKVLVSEYMDGIRLNDHAALETHGVDKQRIVEEITRAYAHQIYVDGFFNGDPHPGNFLVSKEPPHRPILLDFGLTKKLSGSTKQALAKMFLASAEGDHVALLSSFAEMGLKLRLDMPEQAMEVTNVIFRTSTPAKEAVETAKNLSEQRSKNMKVIQEKMKMNEKEMKRFNPVDAFPGDIIIFFRVLNLLRGLSSTMDVRIVYQEIMRPFAESVLLGNIKSGPAVNKQWICDTPVHSDVEAKLRRLLVELGNDDKILGVQVCAYKDGKVIIDTAAGVLGRYDPRPVQPDSLFPVFSATKGITAGMLHWLVDKGYHASGKKFQEILEEALIHPLKIDGELYIGIPPGVESRLATLTLDTSDLSQLSEISNRSDLPSTFQAHNIAQAITSLPAIFNMLNTRRAILPAANGHCSARALARYYAALADGGAFPPPHSSSSKPPLGSHPHIPKFSPEKKPQHGRRKKSKDAASASWTELADSEVNTDDGDYVNYGEHARNGSSDGYTRLVNDSSSGSSSNASTPDHLVRGDDSFKTDVKLFNNTSIHDAFLGVNDYGSLALPNGKFGLGFARIGLEDGSYVGFGHSGMGGSTGFCDFKNKFAIAVTLNKMSLGATTRKIIQLVCSELNIPVPDQFRSETGPEMQKPMIN
ncbi:hypothetical protein Tsubulata_042426 [Turnera subulata]|uniref:Beta-lactamase-related domain-containing protein n=1 Tax=Turnera subulata TaxID=218843 RepID=A0A9Q0F9C1_9ROSI|nr:hypothetical protein Tsubulata_042426 [Turnera subulata]